MLKPKFTEAKIIGPIHQMNVRWTSIEVLNEQREAVMGD